MRASFFTVDGKGVDWSLFPFRGAIIVALQMTGLISGVTGLALGLVYSAEWFWLFAVPVFTFVLAVHLEAVTRQSQARVDAETKARTHHKCTPECR